MDKQIKVISDINQAELIWKKLVISDSWYHQWNVRLMFYEAFSFPVRFYTQYYLNKPIAVLPLQFNTQEKKLTFFGSGFMEENQVFFIDNHHQSVKQLFAAIDQAASLESINQQQDSPSNLEFDCYKYILDVSSYEHLDDYLAAKLKSKRRKNFKKIIECFENLKITVKAGNKQDLDLLFILNRQRFGQESSFYQSYLSEVFRNLLKLNYDWQILTFWIKRKKVAVSLAVNFRQNYIYLNTGVDIENFSNLGNYVILKNIEQAINLKAKIFDAGLEDLGWKERWHLTKIPQYKLVKKI